MFVVKFQTVGGRSVFAVVEHEHHAIPALYERLVKSACGNDVTPVMRNGNVYNGACYCGACDGLGSFLGVIVEDELSFGELFD